MSIPLTDGLVDTMPPALREDAERRLIALVESGRVTASSIGLAIAHAAMAGYQQGRTDALAELLTTEQAAARLGLSPARVRALAAARHVGWQIGRDWLFRPEDLAAMAARRPGRPRRPAVAP